MNASARKLSATIALSAALAATAALTAATPAPADGVTGQISGSDRAYELVSPADTGGYPVASLGESRGANPVEGTQIVQISPDGTVFFVSRALPAGTGAVANGRSLAVFASKRTAAGWGTTDLTPFAAIGDSNLVAGSADGSSILIDTVATLVPADQDNPFEVVPPEGGSTEAADLYRIGEGAKPQLVSQGELPRTQFRNAPGCAAEGCVMPPFVFNQNLSAVGFTSAIALSGEATAGVQDCYAWSLRGALAGLTNPDHGTANCDLLGMTPDGRAIIRDTSGDSYNGGIFVDVAGYTSQFPSGPIPAYQLSGPTVGATTFNGLSPDGSIAYVTTTDQLEPAQDTNASGDLYGVDVPQFPTVVANPPSPSNVTCISCAVDSTTVTYVGQSADGSHVFFTTEGPEAGLWSWDGNAATRLTSASDVSQVVSSRNGNYVVGLTAQLANNPNNTADIYEFAVGQPPNLITSGTSADTYSLSEDSLEVEGIQGLFSHGGVSDNGQRIIYNDTPPGGSPEVIDEWVNGQTEQISPRGSAHRYFVLATTGDQLEDVFFLSHEPLVPQDLNGGTQDIYDARVGGGFTPPSESVCIGNECQGNPTVAPTLGSTPPSQTFSGPNNPVTPPPAQLKHHKKKHGKKAHKKGHRARHANVNRRASR